MGTKRAGDKMGAHLWSFSTPKVRYFPPAGPEQEEEVLGDEFEGVLVSDSTGPTTCTRGRTRGAGPTCCVTSIT